MYNPWAFKKDNKQPYLHSCRKVIQITFNKFWHTKNFGIGSIQFLFRTIKYNSNPKLKAYIIDN